MLTHPKRKNTSTASQQWAEEEFASLKTKDARRVRRLKKVAADLHAGPGYSLPQASRGSCEAKAAYRLIEGGRVAAGDVLGAHAEAALRRVEESGERVLLAPQDTTSLNFARRPNTEGLGPIGNKAESGQGFFIHSTLCVGAGQGEVFGALGATMWARKKEDFKAGAAGARNRKRIEEKESHRWLEGWRRADELYARLGGRRKVVSVADREGDIYEGFALCLETKAQRGGGADLLVRAQHDRKQARGEGGSSWSEVEIHGEAFSHTVEVPRGKGARARKAVLEVRFMKVEVEAPAHKRKYLGLEKPLVLWLVAAREVSPPQGQEPVCWRLWTTVEIGDCAAARTLLGWYAKRWQIEEFHRILKSGCRTEERQLESLAKLEVVAALDMVVAVSLLALTKAARNQPGAAADRWLSRGQCAALQRFFGGTSAEAMTTVPSLQTAVVWIARLGGFLGRKGDGFPGSEVLWRGWRRLVDLTAMYELLNAEKKCG